jgi:serine/threonine-protein kinase
MDGRRNKRFGRYEILSELGRGAMGVVYKARDPKINRVVAVKTISLAGQSPEEERDYRERFFREAEAAGRLSHPGIVTIFDVGEEAGTRSPYIVMEFVGGQSLDKVLERDDHQLPLDKALQLTLELAEALDCAHGQGVVHRDLKPANILLTKDGHAKIADFGVAKLNLANHTLAGRALGTPAYMSPEQLNGEAVDGRSDLFSLGVVLYTIVTGYRPFQGNSVITVSFKVVNHDPMAATLLNTELPNGLDYIIGRAMAKNPAERYQRGMEMVLDIQELRDGREPWSKTKLPGSPARSVAQTAQGRAKSSIGQHGSAALLLFHARSLLLSGSLLQRARRNPLAAIPVLVGVFIFGLWLVSFGIQRKMPQASAPLPGKAVAMPTPSAPPAVAVVETPVGNVPPPVSSSPTTPPTPPRTTAPSAKAAHAAARFVSPATLDIDVEHTFLAAHLTVWVDDHATYTQQLAGTDKKRMVVFHGVRGHFSHALQLAPGKHRVRVRVVSGGDSYDQSGTVTGDFASGKEKLLRVRFNKHGEMDLSLQ